jgi:hypothetical protein
MRQKFVPLEFGEIDLVMCFVEISWCIKDCAAGKFSPHSELESSEIRSLESPRYT